MRGNSYRPLTLEELAGALGEDPKTLSRQLDEMEVEGLVVKTRKKKYGLPEKMGLVAGVLEGHAKGFAFLLPGNSDLSDVYIPAENLNGAMHNDYVLARYTRALSEGEKPEGEVVRVLRRGNRTVVGTLEAGKQYAFVVPDEKRIGRDIFVPPGQWGGAENGMKVVAEITAWPQKGRNPEGRVLEVLGRVGDPGVDIVSIIKKFGLPEEFPAAVLEEAEQIPLQITPQELERRRDLRELTVVTIDGEDAKDLDDAVSLEILPSGNYLLGVHIADVSYYVREDTLLDQEALKRATSVYLADRVIPMLPPRLSNGICSLNAGEDRLAFSVMLEINPRGAVVSYEIIPSILKVTKRLTYTVVRQLLTEEDQPLKDAHPELLPMLRNMGTLAAILKGRRLERGAVDFDFPEAKVKLDEKGQPLEIIKLERSIAEGIIEEFMILANETVARHAEQLDLPFIYRIHEEPTEAKLARLKELLGLLGHAAKLKGKKPRPKMFQDLLEGVKGLPEERLVSVVALRSMQHARYAPFCYGHFGLASAHYCHFTSPIRRYPDLIVHRVLHELLAHGPESGQMAGLASKTELYSLRSSEREKVAEEAEREALDLKKAQYMERHLGEEFDGVISGVTAFGIFVELDNTVEGLVHVSTMTDDYYQYLEKQMALWGNHTRKQYRLGDRVRVKLVRVDPLQGQVDFELV